MKIYGIHITGREEISDFNSIFPFLPKEKKKKIKNFIHKEDAVRTILGEWMIRTLIHENLNIPHKDINLEINNYGKPHLPGYNNFHFNISHSGKWVVCATDISSVGIDIELISPIDLETGKHVFSQEEYKELLSKREEERLSYFYELWTLKESYIKNTGEGLSFPLNLFTVIGEGKIKLEAKGYYFKQYDIDKNYKLSVCGIRNKFPKNINPFYISSRDI